MGNSSKKKGTAHESAVVTYLREHGFPTAERRALNGSQDKGDVAGVIGWVLECKSSKTFEPGPWLDEAEREAENAGVSRFAVVAKRRLKSDAAESFAILPLWLLVELMGEG